MIKIINAQQNNLKNISLEIPSHQLIVVTGVSGSGKSSLAFDIINKEGQRLFLINQSAQARKYLGKLQKARVEKISGLSPTISIAQKTSNANPRSTVGTLTEIYDNLRLLFARLGKSNTDINRSLFSFNSQNGMCPNCQGLGVEDIISIDLLIDNENKSIREGCFKIVNPDGYIIYSQVRMEELEKVCQANGFSVDIPWKDLNNEQQDIVLNGSDKIKILYGKHSLESRMKWTGIKANPREKEFYKGILPVMNEILRRDRNPNILRFAKTQICSQCNGARLKQKALNIKILGKTIYELSQISLSELEKLLEIDNFLESERNIAEPIIKNIQKKIRNLKLLGLNYLSLDRNASSLSGGEMQSIRLALQVNSKLNNITYVFDEPSIGLHPSRNKNIIKILKLLVSQGNTVIVVEHDAETIRNADWIIEIGPKAGLNGGELLFNGSIKDFFNSNYNSATKAYLTGKKEIVLRGKNHTDNKYFSIKNAQINNLKDIDVNLKEQAINVITGVSGAGKSSLIRQT
jgi:excinuclease ABC subunit A